MMGADRTATGSTFRLSQEMIAMLLVGITLTALQLYRVSEILDDGRVARAAHAEATAIWIAEERAARAASQAQLDPLRDPRAD